MTARAARSIPPACAAWLAAACSTPVPSIEFRLADSGQKCPFTDCSMIAMPCKTVMSMKFIDRDDPNIIHHSQCTDVPFDRNPTMCSMEAVDIKPVALPVREMEVQVALYPASMIPSKAAPGGGPDELECPDHIDFAANGFPVEQWPAPALGGRTYYHPGDSTVTVKLGCTDLLAIEQSCAKSDLVTVTATVDDFDTMASVEGGSSGIASQLEVSVGEPRMIDGEFRLRAADTHALEAVGGGGPIPTWQSELDAKFGQYVCVDVVEAVAQTTAVVRCKPVNAGQRIDATGMWISRVGVQKILGWLSPAEPETVKFPDEGITVGIVVDQAAIGIPNMTVTPATGSVRYLTGQGMLTTTGTSSTGIFVSSDAPFGTMFAATGSGRPMTTGIGGLVAGKITVVVLQLGNPPP
jgi:hypothetical protein